MTHHRSSPYEPELPDAEVEKPAAKKVAKKTAKKKAKKKK